MIIDCYTANGTWLDSLHTGHNNVRRVLSEWNRRWGPVELRAREGEQETEPMAFDEWIMSV